MADPVMFQVGAYQEVITPPIGTPLAGYFHMRKGERIRDDLYARAMVIQQGGERLVLVSCDLIWIARAIADKARLQIGDALGIAPERILIAATHTHTGPATTNTGMVPSNPDYLGRLPGLIAKAVEGAAMRLRKATLRAGTIDVPGYSFNRLFRLNDGSEVFGKRHRAADVIGRCGPLDTQMLTLSAHDEAHRMIALVVNFPLHVDVIGGGHADFISADWPGEMALAVAGAHAEDVVTLFLQGCSGDINHSGSTRLMLPNSGEAGARRIGRGLAGAAMAAAGRAEPMTEGGIRAAFHDEPIPYYTRTADFFGHLARLKAKDERTEMEVFQIERGEQWPFDNQICDVPLQTLRVGDLALAGLPAEIFNAIGLEIRHWSPARHTMVAELANGHASIYVSTTDQAERGAYGAQPILSRWLCADAGRRMADRIQVMFHQLEANSDE